MGLKGSLLALFMYSSWMDVLVLFHLPSSNNNIHNLLTYYQLLGFSNIFKYWFFLDFSKLIPSLFVIKLHSGDTLVTRYVCLLWGRDGKATRRPYPLEAASWAVCGLGWSLLWVSLDRYFSNIKWPLMWHLHVIHADRDHKRTLCQVTTLELTLLID